MIIIDQTYLIIQNLTLLNLRPNVLMVFLCCTHRVNID